MNPASGNEPPRKRQRIIVVVPTIGTSPALDDCLAALADCVDRTSERRVELHRVIVAQGPQAIAALDRLEPFAELVLPFDQLLGFAAASNAGLRAGLDHMGDAFAVAFVNDDAIVTPGWLELLIDGLIQQPRWASIQGLTLLGLPQASSDPADVATAGTESIDSAGFGWRRWRAQQLSRGDLANSVLPHAVEVYGVNAAAALYRIEALGDIRRAAAPFEEALETYYEDVELACALRTAGWQAGIEPGAIAWHGASLSRPSHHAQLLVANRHLVLARVLGRRYLAGLPLFALQDLRDFSVRALSGWWRAAARLSGFAHLGAAQDLELSSETPERAGNAA